MNILALYSLRSVANVFGDLVDGRGPMTTGNSDSAPVPMCGRIIPWLGRICEELGDQADQNFALLWTLYSVSLVLTAGCGPASRIVLG